MIIFMAAVHQSLAKSKRLYCYSLVYEVLLCKQKSQLYQKELIMVYTLEIVGEQSAAVVQSEE